MNTKRFSIVFFSIIAALIVASLVSTIIIKNKKVETTRAKLVIPTSNKETEESSGTELYANSEFENISLVQLKLDETLISTLGVDFNGDSYEDQVIGIKQGTNPNIIVVFGEYNPKKSVYERVMEVQTKIPQVKTFNLMTMDLIGNHLDAVIFSGISENNNSIMQAYMMSKKSNSLAKIIDFDVDGTVFIQQNARNDNYAIYGEDGESFSILVSTTEEKSDGAGFDQIQTLYDWDKKQFSYIEKSSTRISGRRIAAKELSRIQDGTVETFQDFLSGLWTKTNDKNGETLDIFFNPDEKEIIFCTDEIQEVYDWLNSSLRRYGISISTANKSISNLKRHFYIDLVSSNEIRIHITDDVRMLIATDTNWDGIYRKKDDKNSIKNQNKQENDNEMQEKIAKILNEGHGRWKTQDQQIVFNENMFTFLTENLQQTGSYAITRIYDTDVIQFRSDKNDCILDGFFMYKLSQERLDLIPINLSSEGCIISGRITPLRFEKYKS